MNDPTAPATASIREYARRCGWSPAYVCKLKAAGTLPCIDGKIDVARADAILAKRSDPGRKGGSRRRKARAGKSAATTRPSGPSGAPSDLAAADVAYTDRRSTKTDLENELLRERLARERGESLERAAAVRLLRDLGAGFGGMVERYPDRIASQIAAQLGVDPHRSRALLVAMSKDLRNEFATLAQTLASRMGTSLE